VHLPGNAENGPRGDNADVRRRASRAPNLRQQRTSIVNRIIWLVGAVVIILFVLSYFGLR
jgi:hypothetical protein